jgi:hypothetical protein
MYDETDDCTTGADITTALMLEDMDNLRHMLGVSEQHPRGYRNYYVAGAADVPSMERLRANGLVIKNDNYKLSKDACYHATPLGARFIGLKQLPR